MFTLNVAIPKPISVNKNIYISSIKFKYWISTLKKNIVLWILLKLKKFLMIIHLIVKDKKIFIIILKLQLTN